MNTAAARLTYAHAGPGEPQAHAGAGNSETTTRTAKKTERIMTSQGITCRVGDFCSGCKMIHEALIRAP